MSEEYGSDFISISDEDGNDYELEHLDTIELDGKFYLAFLPADMDENDENYGIVVLRMEEDEEGNYFEVPDEEEEQRAYEVFMERLFSEEEEEE